MGDYMRTKRSVLNFITGYVPYLVVVVLGFIKARVFIGNMGEEIFALNQLFINIFVYLSLVEAGIGAAFAYRLYKFFADKDYDKINEIYSGTKDIFKKIGFIVIGLGFVISFIVPIFLKDSTLGNIYVQIAFLLFVLKGVIEYFMFTPKLVLQADHKMYKVNFRYQIVRVVEIIVEIILLMNGVNFLLVLIPGIFIRIIQNYITNKKVFKVYPWLKYVDKKDMSTKRDIKHLMAHRIVGLVSDNIDIVILSTFVNAKAVVIYTAYRYLMKYATDSIVQVSSSIKDGIGNAIHSENMEKVKSVINEFFTLLSYFATLIVVVFYFVLDKFVGIWVGNVYLVSKLGLILFLIILYYRIISRALVSVRDTMGLFKETKIMAAIEAAINLGLSLLLVKRYGIEGVLIATVIAFTLTSLWYYPYFIYNRVFNEKPWNYFLKLFLNTIVTFGLIIILKYVYLLFNFVLFGSDILNWVVNTILFGFVATLIVTSVYGVMYKSFRSIINRLLKVFRRRK